jgi:hypothetical protein
MNYVINTKQQGMKIYFSSFNYSFIPILVNETEKKTNFNVLNIELVLNAFEDRILDF